MGRPTMTDQPAPLPEDVPRRTLLRWVGWFGVVNGAILTLVGLRYLMAAVLPDSGLAWVYMGLVSVSQFALLSTLPIFLVTLPLVLLLPRRRWVSALGILTAATLLTLLILDTNIFEQYRYHMSALTVVIFETSTWVFAGIVLVSMLAFQTMLAGIIWRACLKQHSGKSGVWLGLLLVLVAITGQGIHVWADATSFGPVTQFTRVLPLYYPLKAKRSLANFGLMDEAEMERLRVVNQARTPESGQINYPLAPMQCLPQQGSLPNILYIVVDAMRRDQLDPELTPALAGFATESLDFQNHYSGGNSSRMGFFSMFYGLPSTYWQTFYNAQLPPVLMGQLEEQGYSMGLFSAVGFGSPSQIDRTVFAATQEQLKGVQGLDDAALSDAVTAGFNGWLANYVSESPFFGFLYYDPGSDWPASPGVDESDLTPGAATRAGYRRGLQLVDGEIKQVLSALEASGKADNTLVIIASDHGYEFDELGLGYIGHASNFARWQLVSTLMMRWPGKPATVFSHRSAHQDLPVTLLQEVFACSNPPGDYASGKSLFDTTDWEWLIAGSYNSHAIVQPDKVVVTYPGGFIEVLGKDYLPSAGLSIDGDITQDVMLEMRRFYQ